MDEEGGDKSASVAIDAGSWELGETYYTQFEQHKIQEAVQVAPPNSQDLAGFTQVINPGQFCISKHVLSDVKTLLLILVVLPRILSVKVWCCLSAVHSAKSMWCIMLVKPDIVGWLQICMLGSDCLKLHTTMAMQNAASFARTTHVVAMCREQEGGLGRGTTIWFLIKVHSGGYHSSCGYSSPFTAKMFNVDYLAYSLSNNDSDTSKQCGIPQESYSSPPKSVK